MEKSKVMKSRLFYRIVGVITIIILLIVFLPNLSREKKKTINVIEKEPISLNTQPVKNDTQHETQESFSSIEELLIKKNAELKSYENKQESFSIQLVALRKSQEVERLIALLSLHNYDVYTEPKTVIDGQLTRLYVGPFANKKESQQAIKSLQNLTGFTGLIITK